jgi:hypothetical protein
VDLANARWITTIGDPGLIVVWQHPDFDPKRGALRNARVLENSMPR